MEAYTHCQSCGMPLDDPRLLGSEKDGAPSMVYCRYCYRNGAFTHPDMTLDEMKTHMQQLMTPSGMTGTQIKEILDDLPKLTRWLGKPCLP